MPELRDRLLPNAGGLLIAAGAVTALTGGAIGLGAARPFLVIFSVLLLMGYGVVGYLLMTQGDRTLRALVPVTAGLVVGTIWLLQSRSVDAFLDPGTQRFVLQPTLALLLSFAAGAMVFALVEDATRPVAWPRRGAPGLAAVLHGAAAAPIWAGFALVDMTTGAPASLRATIVSACVLVAIACVVGGYAASRMRHPALTVGGAALGFLACAAFLYQFMLGGGDREVAGFGETLALLGLIATGLPVAIASVAWTQTALPPQANLDGGEAVIGPRET